MKIVIIGTSNSVMGNSGFVESLKLSHNVIQLSCGRVNFFYHIKTIVQKRELIEECDLLIIDHYINDLLYIEEIPNYYTLLNDFYHYVSFLNVNILNVFFPLKENAKKIRAKHLEKIKFLCREYRISTLDLNEYNFTNECYRDEAHINQIASYAFGLELSSFFHLNELLFIKEKLIGKVNNHPYRVIKFVDFFPKNKHLFYQNSLLEFDYISLTNELNISLNNTEKLLSIGYFKDSNVNSESGIFLNLFQCGFSDFGYFHEAVDYDITGSIRIKPLIGMYNVKNLMNRGVSVGEFKTCYLVDMLLCDSAINFDGLNNRKLFSVQLPNLVNTINRLSQGLYISNLSNETIDALRDLAVQFESINLSTSFELMTLANQARPTGPFIKQKLKQYKEKLGC